MKKLKKLNFKQDPSTKIILKEIHLKYSIILNSNNKILPNFIMQLVRVFNFMTFNRLLKLFQIKRKIYASKNIP